MRDKDGRFDFSVYRRQGADVTPMTTQFRSAVRDAEDARRVRRRLAEAERRCAAEANRQRLGTSFNLATMKGRRNGVGNLLCLEHPGSRQTFRTDDRVKELKMLRTHLFRSHGLTVDDIQAAALRERWERAK